jgi:5-methylthioadenosine/S-adenosylhomocysteine deaminase
MFTPLMPENKAHLFSHLVFAANGSCVDTTIIDGKIVMEHRQLTTVDEQKVLSEANDAFRRILDRMVVPPPA